MTTDEKIDRLAGVMETLTASVIAHNGQIESLIKVAETLGSQIKSLITMAENNKKAIQDLSQQWQAYINRLPRQ